MVGDSCVCTKNPFQPTQMQYPTYTIPLSWDLPIKHTAAPSWSLSKAFLHSVIAHDILLFKIGHLWHRLHRGFLLQISELDLRVYLESNSDYLLVYTAFSSSSTLTNYSRLLPLLFPLLV